MGNDKTGRVVWHDLFTRDRPRAMSFYRAIAGWQYKTEYATDFAWGPGAQDYVLALSGTQAGAGFIEAPAEMAPGWVAYVEVDDVDDSADLAARLGGGILRAPFDVPGVGRNALLRDPNGAMIGIALSRHSFPVPERQFGTELYALAARPFPLDFYGPLFGWMPKGDTGAGQRLLTATDHHVATTVGLVSSAQWVPNLKVANPPEAVQKAALIGRVGDIHHVAETSCPGGPFILDPDGTVIHLTEWQKT